MGSPRAWGCAPLTPAASTPSLIEKNNEMAKTGIHIKRCNVGSVEAHNKRTKGYIEGLKKAGVNIYFFQELSRNNRSWVNPRYEGKTCEQLFKEMIEEYKAHHKKHQAPALKDVKRINKKTGKEYTVAGWSPIREGVVPIKEDTKLSDFKPIEEWARGKGLDVVRIDMHHDEGYKDEETGNIKFNRHAHIVFDWLDHQTGKTLKLNEQDMSELQDVVAKALDMERGESKAKTGAEHRDVEQQRIHADKQRIKAQQQQISDNNRELSKQEQEIEGLKESLAEINNQIAPDSYNWEKDKNEGFQLGEMIEYLLDDVEEYENEALKTQQTLYAKEKELEEVDFRLSKAKKEVDMINDTLESKKRLISQINTQIKEFTDKLQGQQKEYDEKALKIAHFNSVLENYKEQQSILYEVAKQKISVFGISAYELLANTAGELQQIYKKKAEQLNNNVNDAISRIVDFSHNAAKKGFSQEDYMVFDSVLGKENRESKARYLIERAEEKIGFSSYMGKNIVHRDILDFARDNTVSLRTERGRGIGY